MRLPAIAKQTFDCLSHDKKWHSITTALLDKLEKMKKFSVRARESYREVDRSIQKVLKEDFVQKNISCQRGCSHCCHSLVGVTDDEAALLATKVLRGEVEIDLERLQKQAGSSENDTKWYQLSREDRRCVFLGDDHSCTIYEDRPVLCRTNYAINPPEDCKTPTGAVVQNKLRLLKVDEAHMKVMAAYMACDYNGNLPHCLFQILLTKAVVRQEERAVGPVQKKPLALSRF